MATFFYLAMGREHAIALIFEPLIVDQDDFAKVFALVHHFMGTP